MKLSMIVVITSWAPVWARSQPGMPPQMAPPMKPARIARGRCTTSGSPVSMNPTRTAVMPPMVIWPSTPMLNRPARNPSATDRPAMIRGAAAVSVSEMALIPTKAPLKSAR